MILRRLYELADWAKLLADPSVEVTPVACVAKIGRDGKLTGLLDLRQDVPKGKKTVKAGGLPLPVPMRAVLWDVAAGRWKVTDPAVSGKERPAAFLADTIARILPVDDLIREAAAKKNGSSPDVEVAKCRSQRSTFWRFVRYAADQTGDPTLKVFAEFGDRVLADDAELVARVAADIRQAGLSVSQGLCTLEWTADDGPVLGNGDVMRWWRGFFESDAATAQADLPLGLCQVTHKLAPLASSVNVRVNGLGPIGCRADAYLVVGLETADSYGLKGAQAGMVSAEGIDGFTRAIHALLDNLLPNKRAKAYTGGIRSSMRVGGTQYLFWTRDMETPSGFEILDASPDDFAVLMDSLNRAVTTATLKPDEFRILTLTGNSARVVVRNYLERPLPEVQQNLLKWFADLRIADLSREYQGKAHATFPLWQLAQSTAPDSDHVAPDTHARLTHAALTGGPLPDSILAACLGRLRVPERDPKRPTFAPSRMGLIKLCLNRNHCKDQPVPETLDKSRIKDTPYICGRLLAFMARCQSPKDFGSSARIVERFFASAVMSPRSVFPTLVKHNRNHIGIIRGQNKGFAFNLDKELDELMDLLIPQGDEAPDFPTTLSLAEQGRFAIGFYQQRAEYRRVSVSDPVPDIKIEDTADAV